MIRADELPDGYIVAATSDATLIAEAACAEGLRAAGLDRVEGWERLLTAPSGAAGRGATARLELAPGCVLRLKQLRRGGMTAAVWRDRFADRERLLDNLRVPVEAARREVPTAAPRALFVESAGTLHRAWLAVEELEATDLRTRLVEGPAPARDELEAALRLVRLMHDRGVEHRDLNLGNLLVGPAPSHPAFVIDLDRARLHDGPLEFRARLRALRRLERSYVKCLHPSPASEEVRRSLYDDYAGEDSGLARRLDRGRRAGRIWIELHRLRW